ncbi:MAG: hypothetical protein C5B47_02210 [Verrucomicrobia bacterium]|nr:MAG: hypothetical protein C5B47_02210 [Verrucomicrobiota bacterium]
MSIFFCLSSVATHATASGALPGALPLLAGIETIREDLKLTPLQEVVLDSIRNEYRSEAQQTYLAANFKKASSLQHAEKSLLRLQYKYNRRVFSALNKAQKKRLKEVEARVLGGFLLFRDPVQQSLGLNAAQKTKVVKIENKTLASLERINRQTIEKRSDPFKRAAALHALRESSSAQLLTILTPEQRQKLAIWGKKGPPPGTLSNET